MRPVGLVASRAWRIRWITRGLTIAGLIAAGYVWHLMVSTPHYSDTLAYWEAWPRGEPYRAHLKTEYLAYIYSPAFTQALEPLRSLTFAGFYAAFVGATLAALAWLARPWLLVVLLVPWTLLELKYGQINVLMAACAVAGFRWPGAWAFVLLTKVTPGVGILWFAFRREWRNLLIVAVVTLGIVAVSYALAPHLWYQWAGVLLANAAEPLPDNRIQVPLWLRLGLAVALLAWAAPRNHRWAVPVSLVLGTAWLMPAHLVMLVGVIPLVRWRALGRRGLQPRRAPVEVALDQALVVERRVGP